MSSSPRRPSATPTDSTREIARLRSLLVELEQRLGTRGTAATLPLQLTSSVPPRNLRERFEKQDSLVSQLLSELPLAVLVHDRRGRLIYANHAFVRLLGWSQQEVPTVTALLARTMPDTESRRGWFRRATADLRSNDATRCVWRDLAVLARDGRRLYVTVRSHRLRGLAALATTLEDLTEQTVAAATIRDSEQRLATTLDSIADAVITADANTRILRVNPVAERLTGWTQQDATGRPLAEVFRVSLPKGGEASGFSLSPSSLPRNDPVVLSDRRGQSHRVDVSASTVRGPDGQVYGTVVVFRDITHQHALEHRMRQTEKLEALGQLVVGLTHEFNNLLAGTLNYAELLSLKFADHGDPESLRWVEGIVQSTRSASQLIGRVLSFAKERPRQSIPIQIHPLVSQVADLLRRTMDPRVTITLELDPSSLVVRGDSQQLEDALVNLALNARDAMPDGGNVCIGTSIVELGVDFCRRSLLPVEEGRYLELRVTDNGQGIPSHLLGRIFEPFFSTKTDHGGSGLGLSVVYATVRDHGGSLEVESRHGLGTTFRLYLPLDSATPSLQKQAWRTAVVSGCGRILLVDDEPILRKTGLALLSRLGYEVTVAEDGEQALRFFQQAHGEFDLVLLDIIMPRLGGRETLREMRRLDPRVRAVYVSGFGLSSEDPAVEDGVHAIIRKPFTAATLSQCIAQALATPRSPGGTRT